MEKFKWAYLGAGHIAGTTAKELRAGGTNEKIGGALMDTGVYKARSMLDECRRQMGVTYPGER